MIGEENKENTVKSPPLGGGPLGFGDPDDLRLRRTERDIIIPKLIREEAVKKCPETLKVFLDCAKNSGILVQFRCQETNKAHNDCILFWAKKPEFIKEVTDKYLERRSHFRRTGEPMERFQRKKTPSSSLC